MTYKLGILSTHPIQYYSPLYRELAGRPEIDLTVYYAHQQTAEQQGAAGFGVAFEWDVPLLEGYRHVFLANRARRPNVSSYRGCDTPEIAEIIERERFDAFLVHGWYVRSYRQAMQACWRTRTPVMVRGDSTLLKPSGWLKTFGRQISHRRFVPRFDAYLVVGRRAREYYLAFGADEKRMEFSPHFVDNRRFSESAAKADAHRMELRSKWGLGPEQVVFVFAGKLLARKRPMDVITALAKLKERGVDCAGLIIGDGPLRAEIEAEIRATGAPARFAGFVNQSEIPAAYQAGDVLVLPSDGTETWGLVVNEAMACGLPAIVSDQVGCAADLVTDGQTGFIYPMGDVHALAERMSRLASDPVQRRRMGAAAKERVSHYCVEAAADGLCRAVARLTAGKETPVPIGVTP